MRKDKMGLQKEISRIFTGIMLPKKDAKNAESPAVSPPPQVTPPKPVRSAPPKQVMPKPVAPKPVAQKPITPPSPGLKPTAPKTVPTTQKPYVIPEPMENSAQVSARNLLRYRHYIILLFKTSNAAAGTGSCYAARRPESELL